MKAAGIPEDKPTELARRLGLSSYESPKRVKRWLDGENAPRYDETIALLELAGWLNTAGGRRRVSAAPADPLEALAKGVAALEKAQAEILVEVRASRAEREAARSQPLAPPKRRPA